MILIKNIADYKVPATSSLKGSLKLINENKLPFVCCVDDHGRLVGVFTAGDLNRWLIADGSHSLEVPVFEVCQRAPLYLKEGATPKEIHALLEKVPCLPIVDEQRRPIALAVRRHLQKVLQIDERRIGEEQPVFVIAEIGNNHNGSLDLAKRLIDQACDSGADCAKFQMRNLASLYANAGNTVDARENLGSQYTLDLLTRFQLSPDEMFQAFDHCKSLGLIPLCTPWDEVSIAHLEEYGVPAYKVSSADLTNHVLLRALTTTNKPLICSTGMSREAEIRETVNLLQNHGANYALLHCNSTYPAPFKDVHLKYVERLRELGGCVVGYSGHERDIFVPVAAVACGARIIEKHFTLDRSMEGNDHKVSLLPDEFRRMVEGIHQVDKALGQGTPRELSQGEMMNRVTLAKSVFVNCDVDKGKKIELDMLVVKSPGHGLQPNRLKELVGKPSPRSLRAGDVIYPADLGEGAARPRNYSFQSRWGLPVRHHDYRRLLSLSNPKVLEFHLSYKDLELDHSSYFCEQVPADLVVHAPELFEGDHTLDLASPNDAYRKHSIRQMLRVIDTAKALCRYFQNSNQPIGIVTNVGGFSQNSPLSRNQIQECRARLRDSLSELNDPAIQIWPQTMPPFPWHFGGQRFHNLFVDADEIVEFCKVMKMSVCLDISHSKLACNHQNQSFHLFLEKVLPLTAHLHIADAKGVDGEGLQIEEGEIDFYTLGEAIKKYIPNVSWIPEIWQGHENEGEGFWRALERLENQRIY